MCFLFFGTLLFFLIHDFWTSTGLFSTRVKSIDENPSNGKMILSETSMPTNYSPIDDIFSGDQSFTANPRPVSAL